MIYYIYIYYDILYIYYMQQQSTIYFHVGYRTHCRLLSKLPVLFGLGNVDPETQQPSGPEIARFLDGKYPII